MDKKNLQEEITHDDFKPLLKSFIDFACKHLKIKKKPQVVLQKDQELSFGGYNPSEESIFLSTRSRHPVDVFRTLAHELVHHAQNEKGTLRDVVKDGATGSDIENEANAVAGQIMRHFAKARPEVFKLSHITEESDELLKEGLYDQGSHTAVFLAGGSGSGKDWILKRTLQGHGLVEINSDHAVEHLTDKRGLSKTMPPEQEHIRNEIRGIAKNTSKEEQRLAMLNRNGLIINGTADDPEKIATIKDGLEKLGYKTMMLSVGTSNKVSKERNIQRGQHGGREVPEEVRLAKWKGSTAARGKYKQMFGDSFIHIDNNDEYNNVHPEKRALIDKHHAEVWQAVHHFTSTPPDNPQVKAWQAKEQYKRNITNLQPVRANKFNLTTPIQSSSRMTSVAEDINQAFETFLSESNTPSDREWGKPSLTKIYAEDTPGQSFKKKAEKILDKHLKLDKKYHTAELAGKPTKKLYKASMDAEDQIDTLAKKVKKEENLGPTVGLSKSLVGGYGNSYTIPIAEATEGVKKWVESDKTKARFKNKYGSAADQKLTEISAQLSTISTATIGAPRGITSIRESWDKGVLDNSGLYSGKRDEMGEDFGDTPDAPVKPLIKRRIRPTRKTTKR